MDACNRRNLPENYPLSFWEQHLLRYPFHSRVVEMGSQLVGYILSDGYDILSLAVDPLYRRQQWGTRLVHELQSGLPALRLQVRCSNEPAIRLYTQLGFVIQQELFSYYQNPSENGYQMTWHAC